MTGWKTWAALEEVTAANMNSYVRDQVVQVFTNSATRSAAITAPTRGLVSYLTDTGALEVYYGSTTGWAPPWSEPWGLVLSEESNTTQTQTSGTSQITIKTTGNFTCVEDRIYRVTMTGTWYQTVSTDVFNVRLKGGTGGLAPLIALTRHASGPSGQSTITMSTFATGLAAGSRGIAFTAERVTGTGTGGSLSGLSYYFTVEDVGPATSTAPTA